MALLCELSKDNSPNQCPSQGNNKLERQQGLKEHRFQELRTQNELQGNQKY